MKKTIIFCLSTLFVVYLTVVKASDSASVSGGDFTLYGSISDTTLSGSASGKYTLKWQLGWTKGELKNSNSVQTRKMINSCDFS